MRHPRLAALIAGAVAGASAGAAACDLRLEPSPVFGGACQALVGYFNGQRVGPFHISLPDGSRVTAGSCEGYVGVVGVTGNVVDLAPFHSIPARQYTLAADCRSAVITR